jgi:hypothetical protein
LLKIVKNYGIGFMTLPSDKSNRKSLLTESPSTDYLNRLID